MTNWNRPSAVKNPRRPQWIRPSNAATGCCVNSNGPTRIVKLAANPVVVESDTASEWVKFGDGGLFPAGPVLGWANRRCGKSLDSDDARTAKRTKYRGIPGMARRRVAMPVGGARHRAQSWTVSLGSAAVLDGHQSRRR